MDVRMLTAQEALERLKSGNARFVKGETTQQKLLTHQERAEMASEQNPFAIVLGCSDLECLRKWYLIRD